MNAPNAQGPDWVGPIVLTGLVLLFTITCGRWMIALHETGYARTHQDVASISQAVWNTSRGRLGRETILYEGVRDHLEPVILVYALNYTAGGTLHTLLYVHALVIGLGAVPFYALGRRRGLAATEAWFMAAGYLLLPPLHRLIERDYLRMDLLFFPAAALLAYAVTVRRDRLALAAAALMLCVREAGALAVLGLGLHWLCVERRVRSGLALVALGVLWLPFVNYVWLPWILGHPAQHVDHVRSPAMVAQQLVYLGGEGWPLAVLAAIVLLLLRRRWAALLAVPSVLALPFYRMALRYSAPLFSVMWMTIADEIAHWSRPRLRHAVVIAIPCIFAVGNVAVGTWRPPSQEPIRDVHPLLARVPPDASVCSESLVLVHLSTREQLYQFNRRHYFPEAACACLGAEYFLLNRNGRDTFFVGYRRHEERAQAFREIETLGIETVAESGTWVLWRRRGGEAPARPGAGSDGTGRAGGDTGHARTQVP